MPMPQVNPLAPALEMLSFRTLAHAASLKLRTTLAMPRLQTVNGKPVRQGEQRLPYSACQCSSATLAVMTRRLPAGCWTAEEDELLSKWQSVMGNK